MGEFISVSGVIGASSSEVETVLKSFTETGGISFEIVTERAPSDPDIGVITREGTNTSVLYPGDFYDWDEASKYISVKLNKPVFSFHIHDGDLWMYILFDNGKEVDQFNPIPGYWGDVSASERNKWKGNASLVAKTIPDVSVDAIEKYLVAWDLEQEGETKAYPDDEFAIGDYWQLTDFMRKVGLPYPMDENGDMLGTMYRLSTEASGPIPVSSRQKPWWKLW